MKKQPLLLAILLAPGLTSSWAQDAWTQKADFGGGATYGAVGFSIGSKGYIGTGIVGNDFWEYDPATNGWTQKADFGGGYRAYAVGFSIGTKGYIGTGALDYPFNDFWEYDPAANAWTQKADMGGAGRAYAVGFSIGTKGYIGTGYDYSFYYKDFWEYTPDGGGGGLTLTSAASRRTQGGQTFDINLPLSGTSGVEPRSGANEFIIFTFSNNLTAVDSTTSSCGTVVSTTIDSSDAHNVIVQSNGACNQQDVILTLNGVHGDQGNTLTSAAVTVGVLYGDIDGDRRITRGDQDQIKAHRGQTVDGSNFVNDINCSGVIDANDLLAVRNQRGHRLP